MVLNIGNKRECEDFKGNIYSDLIKDCDERGNFDKFDVDIVYYLFGLV